MDFKQKYLKYKQKYLNLKNLQGGFLPEHNAFKFIESIGFEFETNQISPFVGTINGNTLTLEPFGYDNKKSMDSTTNPSIKNVIIEGDFVLTQDSFRDGDKSDIAYNMTQLLKDKNDSYTFKYVSDSALNGINNIIFNVHDNEINTIGHSEFLMTYERIDNSSNIIMNKSHETLIKIKKFLTGFCQYCGTITIDRKTHKIFNIPHSEGKFYFIKWNNVTDDNTLEEMYFTPQITIGVKLINYRKIYFYLIKMAQFNNLIKFSEYDFFKQNSLLIHNYYDICEFNDSLINDSLIGEYNDKNNDIYNFLFLLFTFITTIYTSDVQIDKLFDMDNLHENKLIITRDIYNIMPRQFFSTILKYNPNLKLKLDEILRKKKVQIQQKLNKYINNHIWTIKFIMSRKIKSEKEKIKKEKINQIRLRYEEMVNNKIGILTNIQNYIDIEFGGTKINPPSENKDMIYVELRFTFYYLLNKNITLTTNKLIEYTKPLQNSLKRKRDNEDNDEQ